MENWAHDGELIRELTLRVAALEDNVAFLEVWCEEQQDSLDRFGEPYWFLEEDDPQPVRLYVVDLRDDPEGADESDHERRVRQIRARLDNLRDGLARGAPG
ncbi:MAG TPA: hypothetical protein VGL92_15295 [Acidimicrobiia bacterium]|jgi:hypothetical protein